MGRSRLERQLAAISALREPTRRRLYKYVERQPRAVDRDEAAQAIGVSRALAAFHLDTLVRLRLLKAEYRRLHGRSGPGAGRTSKLYRRSRHQFEISLPHRNHELLARFLAGSHGRDATNSAAPDAAREYGRSLGRRARQRIRGRVESQRLLRCVEDVLESLGFDPYRGDSGEVHLRNCPFDPLSRLYTPVVCGIGQALVRGVVDGVGPEHLRTALDEQPDRCCSVLEAIKGLSTGDRRKRPQRRAMR
jgi:predicted ArsR family transcriptional regulator